jgi:hypothetical protein
MSELVDFPAGGYAFVKGVYPYSQGVRASEGYAIERARFVEPVTIELGFAAIEKHLASLSRPPTALCAAELRSPKPFSVDGFAQFNRKYVEILQQWDLFRDGVNPVARSNVAPELDPPAAPSFYAFSYTVPSRGASPSFVVAGSGEWPEGGQFPDDIVARGDCSPSGLRRKAHWVLNMMESRLGWLGASWSTVSAMQVYTVHDIHTVLREEIVPRAGNGAGLTWHLCRPPIAELEYEMDVRGVAVERVLA